jgi:hypothetical protein
MTVAIIKIIAKKPNDHIKPTAESVASFRLLWTFFSNSFTVIPPIFHYKRIGKENLDFLY